MVSPRLPARTDDETLPPVAGHRGSLPLTGRGTKAMSWSARRAASDQEASSFELLFIAISKSSLFSVRLVVVVKVVAN